MTGRDDRAVYTGLSFHAADDTVCGTWFPTNVHNCIVDPFPWYQPYQPAPTETHIHYHYESIPTEAKAWECPRCKAVNAPHVNRCDCKP